MPPGGLVLRDFLRSRGIDPQAAHERLAGLAAAEGLPFRERERSSPTRLAQELATWAAREGAFAIHDALFRAYFADGCDLGDVDVLVRIAGAVGLEEAAARRVLADRTERASVDADWTRVRAMGIRSVPTFVMGRQGVVGSQPYEVLERLVLEAGASPRA